MKTTSFKGSKFNLKSVLPTQAREFQCHLPNVLEFVLQKHKNGLSITREKNMMQWNLLYPWRWHGRISKPLMVGQ